MAIKIQKQPVAGRKPLSLFSSMPPPVMRPAPMPPRRLVPPPQIRRPIPKPQMSKPTQQFKPPTGLPQQNSAPTGLPNIMQPPLGLPNTMQQPTGLPPTQMQMPAPAPTPAPTPAATQPTSSLFAPEQPIQRIDPSFAQIQGGPYNPPQMQQPAMDTMMPPQMQQPAMDTMMPPQMQQPMQQIDPSFAQIQGGPYNPPQMQQPTTPSYQAPMQQPMQQPPSPFANEPGRDSNGMLIPGYGEPPPGTSLSQPVDKPGDIYGGLTPGQALGGAFTMQQPVAGPIAPDYQYNSDNTMRSISGMGTGLAEGVRYKQSQQFDPITGQWGMPDGTGGKFMPGVSIGY